MTSEFQSHGFFKDRYICYKHDLKQRVVDVLRKGRRQAPQVAIGRMSDRKIKQLILRERLAVAGNTPSWFYTALERGDSDPLTNYALDFITSNVTKESRILVTGCGTGITAFYLADRGYRDVVGIDVLSEAITVAKRIAEECSYSGTSFSVDDGFRPKLQGTFDVITAMHWVFSAWAGNYGNESLPVEAAKNPDMREKLLNAFLGAYVPHLAKNGFLILELTDAVADYRLPADHGFGDALSGIYPVRHTPEQVERCAEANGLQVEDRKLCVSYGHQPRTSYRLKRR